mmetsp:Transcript_56639/g.168566  ORF Transcript_56639/g.168566 Transcript_56639/m.168566 type:complete len:246 (-) Transcript_56639:540-1277(-)
MVGTSWGLNASTLSGSMGTQTLPVLGWTTKGDFSRWFICLLTLMSSLGYVYCSTMSLRKVFASCFCLKVAADLRRSSPSFSIWAQMAWEVASGWSFMYLETASFSCSLNVSRMLARCGPFLRISWAAKMPLGSSLKKCSQILCASRTEGWSSSVVVLSSARTLFCPLATSVRYSATALRCSFDSLRAALSHTQQWTPRRPEYTNTKFLKPKSCSRARLSVFIAAFMKVQHFVQSFAPVQHVRMSS